MSTSPLMAVFEANLVSRMDPMQNVIRHMAQQQLKQGDVQNDDLDLEMIQKISKLLEKDDLDPAVRSAYEKKLARYTS